MDPIVLAAASALVAAMATDGYQRARNAAVGLWRRARPEDAAVIDAELQAVRRNALDGRELGDEERERTLVAVWRLHLQQLLDQDPDTARRIRELTDRDLIPLLPQSDQLRVRALTQQIDTAHGDVNRQSGRDTSSGAVTNNVFHAPAPFMTGSNSKMENKFGPTS